VSASPSGAEAEEPDAAAGGPESEREFLVAYYKRTPDVDIAALDPERLRVGALAHRQFGSLRGPDSKPLVRVYQPRQETDGWSCIGTVIDIVTDDMPFLVDSVSALLAARHERVRFLNHPVLAVRRDDSGRLLGVKVGTGVPGMRQESFIQVELTDVLVESERRALELEVRRTLRDVAAAVGDRGAIGERLAAATAALRRHGDSASAEVREAIAFLGWLDEDNFVPFGARFVPLPDADVSADGEEALGVFRHRTPPPPTSVPTGARPSVAKSPTVSTVRRRVHCDCILIPWPGPGGTILAVDEVIGLFETSVKRQRAAQIPLIRPLVADVMGRADAPARGHDEEALAEIIDGFPREELFATDPATLLETALSILAQGDRREVRTLVRTAADGSPQSCLVLLPRDRLGGAAAERIKRQVADAFAVTDLEQALHSGDTPIARIHHRLYGASWEGASAIALERAIDEATGTFVDRLCRLLDEDAEVARGAAARFRNAFPPSYRAEHSLDQAVADVRLIERLTEADPLAVVISFGGALDSGASCRLWRRGSPIALSDVLPLFEHAGIGVLDSRPYGVVPAGEHAAHLCDLRLDETAAPLGDPATRRRFEEALRMAWEGGVESDELDSLVLAAGLDWRQVSVLRGFHRYLRQTGTTVSVSRCAAILAEYPRFAVDLLRFFAARFDPDLGPDRRRDEEDAARRGLETELGQVVRADADRLLRSLLAVAEATVRTNYFQVDDGGRPKRYLVLKLEPAAIPSMPKPHPLFEIFVTSPALEGVHLRDGKVARGGIRWSDRPDFRAEILGLLKAQAIKNAIIVPLGAKGGFVLRGERPGSEEADREAGRRGFEAFIEALFDLTDGIVDGKVVGPPRTRRLDGDDPHLVIAADKGTATFSDAANAIAGRRGYWLGDAFASGGSSGYDHKKMGITARGAWSAAAVHFRERGLDLDTEPLTVVGIGDMSGDVFGNGMLLSERIRLLAAFDHRHVFLDPDPDQASAYAERRRLFDRPRSSWEDYDRALISTGGGVWPRTAAEVRLAPEARATLGIEAERVSGDELVRAVLRAPVDLLWNGGVGTFVRAAGESESEVGDPSSEAVRVSATELRCAVVAEGGNLGLTQAARIEFAQAGGAVNADAVDNAAGVACSDREVNIKILLDAAERAGEITAADRELLLAGAADEVAEAVIEDVGGQAEALVVAAAEGPERLDLLGRFMRALEAERNLDRRLHSLPDADALLEYRAAGRGLTLPELAVLQAYDKTALSEAIAVSTIPADAGRRQELLDYFPSSLRSLEGQMDAHPLRAEIIATRLANCLVTVAGIGFAYRMSASTGADPVATARAYSTVREVFDLRSAWDEVQGAPVGTLEPSERTGLLLSLRGLVDWSCRRLLVRGGGEDERARARLREDVARLREALPAVLDEEAARARAAELGRLREVGLTGAAATLLVDSMALRSAFDLSELAAALERPVEEVLQVWDELGRAFGLERLRERIDALPKDERWLAMRRTMLREEAFRVQRGLVAAALGEAGADADAARGWLDAHLAGVERCATLIREAEGAEDAIAIPVLLREIDLTLERVAPVGGSPD
jgi:glutamate dehydrogenase